MPLSLSACVAGLIAFVSLLTFAVPTVWAQENPDGQLIEAEDARGSDSKMEEAADASGGKFLSNQKDWQPLVAVDAGKIEGTGKVTIHVRHQGGPLLFKGVVDGKQKEFKQVWAKPEKFTWTNAGTFDRSAIGSQLLIIRGGGGGTVAVDAVVFKDEPVKPAETPQTAADAGVTTTDGDALPGYQPDPAKPAQDVTLAVDWHTTLAPLPRTLWSTALFDITNTKNSTDPKYAGWLQQLNPSLVRVHNAGITRDWWDDKTNSWNVEYIRACFAPHVDWMRQNNVKLMMCIPYSIPGHILGQETDSKYVPPERHDAAVENVRQLVTILKDDLKLPITHWEITNEWDNTYEKAGKLDELWPFVARMIREVKQMDPDAKVGGPALTWAKPTWVTGFLDAAGKDADFISWHNYAAGKPTTPNEQVFKAAGTIGGHAKFVKEELARRGLTSMETYLTEFNVQWVWKPYERRHANNVGAAFLATVVRNLAEQNLTGATIWHCKGNAYGLIDAEGRMRATGQLYLWASQYVHGEMVATTGGDAASGFVAYAVKLPDGGRSVVLVNQTDHTLRVTGSAKDLINGAQVDGLKLLSITADGGMVKTVSEPDALELPGYSVHILTTASQEKDGPVDLPGQHVQFNF